MLSSQSFGWAWKMVGSSWERPRVSPAASRPPCARRRTHQVVFPVPFPLQLLLPLTLPEHLADDVPESHLATCLGEQLPVAYAELSRNVTLFRLRLPHTALLHPLVEPLLPDPLPLQPPGELAGRMFRHQALRGAREHVLAPRPLRQVGVVPPVLHRRPPVHGPRDHQRPPLPVVRVQPLRREVVDVLVRAGAPPDPPRVRDPQRLVVQRVVDHVPVPRRLPVPAHLPPRRRGGRRPEVGLRGGDQGRRQGRRRQGRRHGLGLPGGPSPRSLGLPRGMRGHDPPRQGGGRTPPPRDLHTVSVHTSSGRIVVNGAGEWLPGPAEEAP